MEPIFLKLTSDNSIPTYVTPDQLTEAQLLSIVHTGTFAFNGTEVRFEGLMTLDAIKALPGVQTIPIPTVTPAMVWPGRE